MGVKLIANTKYLQKRLDVHEGKEVTKVFLEGFDAIISSQKHAYIILTPLNPTFI